MKSRAPALVPLFRSPLQLALLGELFAAGAEPLSVTALADRIGFGQPAVSREVRRLAEHEIVNVTPVGRTRLVQANTSLPWYRELRDLLVQTVGPPALLAEALGSVQGVTDAYIFGSWADRFCGEPGAFPRDVDVLVIGTPEIAAVNAACREIERALRVDVNPVLVTPQEWSDAPPASFLGQLRESNLVPIRFVHRASP